MLKISGEANHGNALAELMEEDKKTSSVYMVFSIRNNVKRVETIFSIEKAALDYVKERSEFTAVGYLLVVERWRVR